MGIIPTRMSDLTVAAKTGKTWPEWFKILDAAGGRKMTHKEIVAVLARDHEVGEWWQQMVTVAYEQARGLRRLHERPDGFSVGASKTITASLGALHAAWSDTAQRRRWLSDPGFTVRKETPERSMRITWVDGKTDVQVMFLAKSAGKAVVHVEHNRLTSPKASEQMKAYWKKELEKLKALLEG